jgi:phospholipase/carboxylesterase
VISGPVVAPRSGGVPKQLVVLLHGYGADGEDLIGLADPLSEALPHAMFAAPNAPARCAQNPFGYEGFPIAFDRMRESVGAGAPTARQVIVDYLSEQWKLTGLGPGDTFLVGFSQGAMIALHVGLSLSEPVLGIVSFSGALIPPGEYDNGSAPKLPVCLIHGEIDPVVDPILTQRAAESLNGHGYPVSVHVSPGLPHGISPDGLQFAAEFMLGRLEPATA